MHVVNDHRPVLLEQRAGVQQVRHGAGEVMRAIDVDQVEGLDFLSPQDRQGAGGIPDHHLAAVRRGQVRRGKRRIIVPANIDAPILKARIARQHEQGPMPGVEADLQHPPRTLRREAQRLPALQNARIHALIRRLQLQVPITGVPLDGLAGLENHLIQPLQGGLELSVPGLARDGRRVFHRPGFIPCWWAR